MGLACNKQYTSHVEIQKPQYPERVSIIFFFFFLNLNKSHTIQWPPDSHKSCLHSEVHAGMNTLSLLPPDSITLRGGARDKRNKPADFQWDLYKVYHTTATPGASHLTLCRWARHQENKQHFCWQGRRGKAAGLVTLSIGIFSQNLRDIKKSPEKK